MDDNEFYEYLVKKEVEALNKKLEELNKRLDDYKKNKIESDRDFWEEFKKI